jgi:hypothetical protein
MQKLKAVYLASSVCFVGFIHANTPFDSSKMSEETRQLFIKEGLPIPGSGVTIASSSKLKLKGAIGSKLLNEKIEMKQKGFISSENNEAKTFLNIKAIISDQIKKQLINDPKTTTAKKDLLSVGIAFNAKEINPSLISSVLGFGSSGIYLENQGWTSFVEFFEPKDGLTGSICNYQLSSIALNGTAAIIYEDEVHKEVNGKTTSIQVKGNESTAYMYTVDWWDNDFYHLLNCANKSFSKEITEKVIDLAKQIDKN